MKISIVIPVYNVEKYIEKCLLSCLNQDISFDMYEIIVVNDGSPDNSLKIAERIAIESNNIRIISQNNQGLSAARNTGLQHAKGEYIWFVDSDDYIEKNCLGRITTHLKDHLDILQLQYRLVYEDKDLVNDVDYCVIDGVKSGLDVIVKGGLPTPAPFSIFRTQFLRDHKLEFVRGIYHEDTEFKPRVVYLANKITSDTEPSYNYLQRVSGSITAHYKLKNGLDMLKVSNSLLSFVKEQHIQKKYALYFYRQISVCINTAFYWIYLFSKKDKVIFIENLKKNNQLFSCMIKSAVLKYQIEGVLLKISPRITTLLIEKIYNRTRR